MGHFNIIYRDFSNELLFGGTSNEGLIFEADLVTLRSKYEQMSRLFKGLGLPSALEAKAHIGIRHKGKKRLAYMDKCEEGIFVINSLYKNGFTFSFLAAKKVRSLLEL